MQLSLTSWSLPACTLPEAVAVARALGFAAVDLGYFYGPALDKAAILADPRAAADRVRALGVAVPSFYHLFGDTLAERNLADPSALDRNLADFEQVARFCAAAGIPTVLVLPDVCNRGQDTVPGLRLTLDYAHFVCLGYRQEEIDPLARHAAHVHLRQARPGVLQAKSAQGTINVPAMLGTLRDCGYSGSLAVEYVHQDYMDTVHDDVLTETIRMRDLVRAWLA